MAGIGFQEILLILIVALLIFGAGRLPEIGRSLGKALSEFKKGMQGITDQSSSQKEEDRQDKA